VSGKLNPVILSEDFQFTSPFWKGANKAEFTAKFVDTAVYQQTALAKITHYDPVIQLKSMDENHFAIVLQYHTKNGSHVYETVFGKLADGLLVELRSIYDLDETKKALEIS
jgi:hypothetical protein